MSNYKIELNGYSFYNQKQLTHKETIELLSHYHKYYDNESKEQLIYANLKLVLSLVMKYQHRENIEDLFQVGIIGLIKSIDNFNTEYNLKFSTYAVPLILGEIKKYIRDNSTVKIPRSLKDISYKVMLENEKFLKKHNRTPTTKELSELLKIDEYLVYEAISSNNTISSLSQEVQNDGNGSIDLESQISDNKEIYNELNRKIDLNNALLKLDKNEYDILNRRYYEGKTQVELANELFVSQAQISRIEKKALIHLKKLMSI